MGFRDLFRRRSYSPLDRSQFFGLRYQDMEVVYNLTQHGIDIEQPVHSLFYMYVPSAASAESAAAELRRRELTVTVREPWCDEHVTVDDWTVVAESDAHALIPDFLRETIDACEAIAASHGGRYDGWEAGAKPA